jgi:hypothetical protein
MPASLAFMCVRAGARSGGAARRRGATAVGCVCSTAARLPMAVVHVYVGITDRHAYHRIQRPTLRRFHPSHVSFGLLHRAVCAVEVLSETVGYLTTCTSGSRAHHTGTHLRITADMWVAVAGRSIECARNGGRAKSGAPWGGAAVRLPALTAAADLRFTDRHAYQRIQRRKTRRLHPSHVSTRRTARRVFTLAC